MRPVIKRGARRRRADRKQLVKRIKSLAVAAKIAKARQKKGKTKTGSDRVTSAPTKEKRAPSNGEKGAEYAYDVTSKRINGRPPDRGQKATGFILRCPYGVFAFPSFDRCLFSEFDNRGSAPHPGQSA
jgi:hypothetical protein